MRPVTVLHEHDTPDQQDSQKGLGDQSQFRCLTVVMFAIVDCETTGFGKHDRIVEVARPDVFCDGVGGG